MLQLFSEYLPVDKKDSYTTQKLQQKLERHFGDLITIQPKQGQGMSNLIYSSAISVPEAICAATRLKADMHSVTVHDLSDFTHSCDENQILHAAAGILRKHISTVYMSDVDYPAPEEVSISSVEAYLLSSLKNFLCWLFDDSAFTSANESASVSVGKLRKCLSLAECIVALSKNRFTPFHLGLALQIHHMFGSKSLIEILNSHGFCASYAEVRHYLTSVCWP